jgi:hypothetical protein
MAQNKQKIRYFSIRALARALHFENFVIESGEIS